MTVMRSIPPALEVYLPRVAVVSMLLGAIADFVVGSPGDASLLLAAFVASAIGTLIPSSHSAVESRLMKYLPSSSSKRLGTFGLFTFSAAAVFAKITEDVVENESPHLDRATSFMVHGLDTPTLDTIMRGFSFIGSISVVAFVAVAVMVWCWRRRDGVAIGALVGVIAADQLLKPVLKHIFERPRPDLFHEVPRLDTYGYPSAHAMAAVAIYGIIAVVIGRLAPGAKRWAFWGAGVLAIMIGYSRIYLGLHWITDVLGGFAAGATILGAGIMWLEAFPRDDASAVKQPAS
jgi:undecaprenyl-diphosphatase